MATSNHLIVTSLPADSDRSALQYVIVKLDSNGRVATAGVDARAFGIQQDAPAAIDRACGVAVGGKSKVLCGGTIAKGAPFTSDANGKAVAITSGDNWSMGIMIDAGANGSICSCLIQPTGRLGISGQVTA